MSDGFRILRVRLRGFTGVCTWRKGSIIGPAILLAMAAAAAWATSMTVAKPGVRHMDPLSFMLGRWSIVVVLAGLYSWLTGALSFPGWQPIVLVVLAAVLDSVVGWVFYLLAMQRTSAHQTATLSSTAPLWGVAGAMAFLGDPVRWSVLVAALLVILGAYFLMGGRPMTIRSSLVGSSLALAAGVLWGIAETVPMKLALQQGMTPALMLLVLAGTGVVGTAVLTPLLRRLLPKRIERRGLLFMTISALSGAFLGWLLWLYSLRLAPASVLSPVRGSTLVFAFAYAVLFLRERPSVRALVGVLLVLAGVLVVSLGS